MRNDREGTPELACTELAEVKGPFSFFYIDIFKKME